MLARELQVNGIVQGVGFRPFVARLARQLGLCGWVGNSVDGVRVHVEAASAEALDAFEQRLAADAPPAARIVSLRAWPAEPQGLSEFRIRASNTAGTRDTLVSPDLATCDECLAELFDPEDARYHYPFINCTNCGPRFTIIEDLPYDRPVTSMKRFAMCESCAAEYADETDRRYHAQPDACFACGPRLWWVKAEDVAAARGQLDADGALVCGREHLGREESDALVQRAAEALAAGEVLAIKGLGGWHLACDATDQAAVARLRARKRRPTKPLAIMVRDVHAARALAGVSTAEEALLTSRERPIVLLQRQGAAAGGPVLAEGVAGVLPEVGVMLPSTPLQHLLLRALDVPLVMTSGNVSGEPIVATDAQAFEALAGIADAFLGNNRAIVARYDDSVTRMLDGGREQLVRRARGLAPAPLLLPEGAPGATGPCVFAAGPEQKATFAWAAGARVYVSQHLGDLEHLGAWDAWEQARARYERLFGLRAEVLACDAHPEYLASKWARGQAEREGLPLLEVQHHHAHIASVLGEHGLEGPVIGVALDGTGYGSDGTIWGGEVLIATRAGFERFWHLPCFTLPGGAAAIRQPQRTAYALLVAGDAAAAAAGGGTAGEDAATRALLAPFRSGNPQWTGFLERLQNRPVLDTMLAKGLNSPLCSSAGRLFDAVAALLGVCEQPGYDGEAACLLEAAARRELAKANMSIAQWATRFARDAHEHDAGPLTALRFHELLVRAIIAQCERARRAHGLATVAASGGCLANRLVAAGLAAGLSTRGFSLYTNKELPCNDGCIAYGQAIVARAKLLEE